MANFNKVILAGNLTRDPQLSYTPSNTPVAEFGMAINRKWRTPDGQSREEVCFVDCTCFGKQAETLNKYVRKGRPLLVDGRLRYESWESKEGQKRSRLTVVVESFQFLDNRRDAGDGGDEPARGDRAADDAHPREAHPPVDYEAAPAGGEVPF